METELDNWTNKYDDFMDQQNGRIQAIQEEYDDEKADLVDLRERFAILKGKIHLDNWICILTIFIQRSMMPLCMSDN